MKAILRWGTALLSLLLLTSVSHAQYQLVSPVFKTPFPSVPSPSNSSGIYLMDAYGRWTGPHYYLVPPHQPFGGVLPGPIGQAIMSGYLPHELLMDKQAMAATLEGVPTLGKHGKPQQAAPQQNPHGGHGHGGHGAPGSYPTLGTSAMQQYGTMQMPHQAMATGQYAMPMPYAGAMPYQGMQAPMGYGPKPMMWAPYPGQAQPAPAPYPTQGQPHATHWKASNGIWQVQNAPMPHGKPAPFTTIPGFQPGVLGTMPPMPGQHPGFGTMPPMQGMNPGPMMMPPPNLGGAPGMGSMQQFPPMQQFDPMSPLQGPQPRFDQMQMPSMGAIPPQAPPVGGSAYPVHPFTRSPRDFFMWGEVMEQERARANRPFPVP